MPDSEVYQKLVELAPAFGFEQVGVYSLSQLNNSNKNTLDCSRFNEWLRNDYHGDMYFMEQHAHLRCDPTQLEPWVKSIIVARMDYLQLDHDHSNAQLMNPEKAFIARYALGRDYHKLIRNRLKTLAQDTISSTQAFTFRPFADSAPILEKQIASATSVGWQGKNTLVMNRRAGSWFFLGMLFTDLELTGDEPHADHCGQCTACIDICPTKAIIAPYQLDARLCIAYLTIEHKGVIAEELRPLIGNRVFGCDDCQLTCPWNKFAQLSAEDDFKARHSLDTATLISLFSWDEATFLSSTEGSAIRRLGHERWLRNVAIGLGNALRENTLSSKHKDQIISALSQRSNDASSLVREHVQWALQQQIIDKAIT